MPTTVLTWGGGLNESSLVGLLLVGDVRNMCLASTVTEVALGFFKQQMNMLKAKIQQTKKKIHSLLDENLSWFG